MKKSTLLKSALTVIAALTIGSAYAQTPNQYTATQAEEMVQTAGISFKLYVDPDPLYSPTYDADGALNAKSRWTFTIPTGLTATTPVVSGTAVSQNWVEITSPVAADDAYAVKAVESNTDFACVDAGITTNIKVIAKPTATLTVTATPTGWTERTAGSEYYRCAAELDEFTADSMQIAFTEDAARVANAYDYILSSTKEGFDLNNTSVVASTAGEIAKANMLAIGSYVTSPVSYVNNTQKMKILKDASGNLVATKYVISLDNISSKTSYLSYFRASTGSFTATIAANYIAEDDEVTFWLYPAPVTGPIYHISNTYAF